jgi:hypothetical protein
LTFGPSHSDGNWYYTCPIPHLGCGSTTSPYFPNLFTIPS